MNISKIAELAGVSRAAVSRYLNDGYISEEKKSKIKEVIEKTGYIPSTQAQTLRTKKTKLIGIILPKISSEVISHIVDGISASLESQGYHVLLGSTDNNIKKELDYLNIFNYKQVDGIIFIATIFTKDHKEILKQLRVPIVVVGQVLSGFCCVYHDDYGAAKELTNCLVRAGCSNIGYIGVTESDMAAGYQRKSGYLSALEDAKLEVKPSIMTEGEFTMDSGYEQMKNLLTGNSQIDGIFCATDSIAVGAMLYLREQNISIPDSIAVVGVGDTRMSKVVSPTLTTAHLHYKTSGIDAVNMLINLLSDHKAQIKEEKLSFEIIKRQSTYGL